MVLASNIRSVKVIKHIFLEKNHNSKDQRIQELVFEKINKIHKPLGGLIKKKREEPNAHNQQWKRRYYK